MGKVKNTNEDKNIVGEWITFNVEYGDGESTIGKPVVNQKYIETLTQVINSDNGKVYQVTIRDGDTGDIVSEKSYINGK